MNSIQEAIDFITARPKPLALYIFSNNDQVTQKVLTETTSGSAVVNDTLVQYTLNQLPFGGVGESGVGAYHGRQSFDIFTHRKSVLQRSLLPDPSLRFPPFTESKINLVKKALALKINIPMLSDLNAFAIPAIIAVAAYYARDFYF